ncbi:MAG: sulfotransferase domain-containing protein [Stagnimonas sp.]|nr:sulfotransferase domain-containing protein [Stagnimonas sp.]
MIVLCYGMTKSGSTLTFELCRASLEARGHHQRRLSDAVMRSGHAGNFMGKPSPALIDQALQELQDGERIAIKLHGLLDKDCRGHLDAAVAAGRCRVLVSYRDPRDVALSLLDAGARLRGEQPLADRGFARFHDLQEAGLHVARQLQVCRNWASVRGALHLYYEDVAFEPLPVIERIGQQLGLARFEPAELEAIHSLALERAEPLKNRAERQRHRQELSPEAGEALLTGLPGGQEFVERACQARDYRWMAEDWGGGTAS